MDNYEVNMLTQNSFGRSTLTEAFNSGNTDIIEICLSHPSANEDKLLDAMKVADVSDGTASGNVCGDVQSTEIDMDYEAYNEKHAVYHEMFLSSPVPVSGENAMICDQAILKVRELPIRRADNPFGSNSAPEDDTTGLGIWPASVLMARIVVENKYLFEGKVVLELGAGCGLPSLAAAVYTNASTVYLTDVNDASLLNANFNVELNALQGTKYSVEHETATTMQAVTESVDAMDISKGTKHSGSCFNIDNVNISGLADVTEGESRVIAKVHVVKLAWQDLSTYPSEPIDVLLGSDLVYDSNILRVLVPAVQRLIKPGGMFLYLAPDDARDGMVEFTAVMEAAGLKCVEQTQCPHSLFANPLAEEKEDLYVLHFYDLAAKKPHSLFRFIKES